MPKKKTTTTTTTTTKQKSYFSFSDSFCLIPSHSMFGKTKTRENICVTSKRRTWNAGSFVWLHIHSRIHSYMFPRYANNCITISNLHTMQHELHNSIYRFSPSTHSQQLHNILMIKSLHHLCFTQEIKLWDKMTNKWQLATVRIILMYLYLSFIVLLHVFVILYVVLSYQTHSQ